MIIPKNANRVLRGLMAVAVLALAAATPAGAHPHTWVEARAVFGFDDARRIDRITLNFALDELTTSILVEGLDANGNGIFDADELKDLAAENATALSEFDYFTEIQAAADSVSVNELLDHDYAYVDGQLVLTLSLALARSIDPLMEAVTLRLYDPTFYVMVELATDTPVTFSQAAPGYCAASVSPPQVSTVSLTEAAFEDAAVETENTGPGSIGREYADLVTVACPPHR